MDNGDQKKINSPIPTKTLEDLYELLTRTDPDLSISFENVNTLTVLLKKELILHVSRKAENSTSHYLMLVHSSEEEENILVNLLTKTFLTIYVENVDYRYWPLCYESAFLYLLSPLDEYLWPDKRTQQVFKTIVTHTQAPIFEIDCRIQTNPFLDKTV